MIYPGRVHMPLPPLTQRFQLEGAEDADNLLELAGSDKVIGLRGGGYLDGAVADTEALLPTMTPYTLGHIVNHAPRADAVNCKLVGLDVHPSTLPADIRDRCVRHCNRQQSPLACQSPFERRTSGSRP